MFMPAPVWSQDEVDEPTEELTPEEIRERKAEAKAKRKREAMLAKRAKVKFKWHKSLSSALRTAKKYDLLVWVVYSDPETCGVCVKFEKEVAKSRELRKLSGAAVGFLSDQPLEEYDCTGRPSGALLNSKGEKIATLSYNSGWDGEKFAEHLKNMAKQHCSAGEPEADSED